MAWGYLFAAGALEIVWVIGMKYTEGFTRLWPSVFTIGIMVASFLLLSQALKEIPIGTSYAVWTGIGAVGAAIVGMMFFKEPVSAMRIACITLVIAGIAGLKWG
jgi:quaternary ammonium compound-resistance protein SugE